MAGDTGKDEFGAMASVAPTGSFGEHDPSRDSSRRMALSAVVAAILLHVLVIVLVILDWSGLLGRFLPQEAPPIPVSLVFERPPPPPPPPPPAEKPEPAPTPPPLAPRMSGPDERTAAASEDAKVEALPEPKPAAEQPQPRQSGTTADKDKTPPKPKSEATPEGRQAMAEPEPKAESPPGPLFHSFRLPSPHGGTAPRDLAGDPYLNAVKARVESHRIYPPASEFHGVRERLVTYGIQIDPAGNLVTLTLIASSGSSVIDQAAGQMIRASSPFPHIPPSYPQIRTLITGTIPIYPK
jgi:TonB family protein